MCQEYTTVNPIPEEMPPRTKRWPEMKKEIKRTGTGTRANLPKIKLNQMTSRIKLVPPWRNLSPPHLIYFLQNSEKSYCAAWHSKILTKLLKKIRNALGRLFAPPEDHIIMWICLLINSLYPVDLYPPPRQVKIAHTTKNTSLYTN